MTSRQISFCILLVLFSLFFSTISNLAAQDAAGTRHNLQTDILKQKQVQAQTMQALKNAQNALELARQEDDVEAQNIASQAIASAQSTLLSVQASILQDEQSLAKLNETSQENQPLYSKGNQGSTVVDLSATTPDKPLLADPQEIESIIKEKGLKIKELPAPDAADTYFKKPKAQILLDAIEKGRIYGKNAPSDLGVSVDYINNYLLTHDPGNMNVREAVSYLEGMRACTELYPESLPQEKATHDEMLGLVSGTSKNKPVQKSWRGPPNPQAEHNKGLTLPPYPIEDYVPKTSSQQMVDMISGAGTNAQDKLKQWRQERTKVLHYALREGNGNVSRAIDFLEKKINEDERFSIDSPARSALNYMHGYQSYMGYEENLKKEKALKNK